ncbi:MAG: DUF2129 domain-containing protein [Acholeplasmataceae bacterium]
MLAERSSYVIFYKGGQFVESLDTLPVDIAFHSEKSHYVVVYADKKDEENIRKQLKKLKGYKGFSQSQLYDETRNF